MKSKMKKVVSLVLAMAMVLTMGLGMSATKVEAAGEYTITITNSEAGHTYEAYQIFSGTLSDGKLTEIKWGSGIDADKTSDLLSAIAAIEDGSDKPFASCTDAESVADVLSGCNDNDAVVEAFADVVSGYLSTSATGTSTEDTGSYTISGLDAGYYFVKDKDSTVPATGAYTDYILKVVDDVTVTAKSSVPTVEKKVEEKNDSTGTTTGWQDAADYDITDSINYKLTGTMPSTLDDYTVYYYKFTDTLSAGLTYNNDAVVTVYASASDASAGTDGTVITTSCTINATADSNKELSDPYTGGTVLTVEISDVLSLSGVTVTKDSVIVVTYSAKLNENAVIGKDGNPNEVVLTFSNNPNDKTGGERGETPKDLVTVFTFNLEVQKVNEKSEALEGAEFTLYKYSYDESDYKEVKVISTGSTFTFTGLDSGKYKISETVTPTGYNSISDIEFEIAATYDKSSDDPQLTALEVQNATSGTTFTVEGTSFTKVSTTITNKSGSVLPSTGGIGTTIFYIVGAILVLGAGVVLVTRRRTAR